MRELIKQLAFRAVHMFRQDRDGFVDLDVRSGATKGLKLSLDLLGRRKSAYWLGKYDADIFETLKEVIQPGWNCWDCGVYIGLYTCFLARQIGPSGRVVGFEPDRNNLVRANKNIELNGLTNARLKNYAVAGPRGHVDFIVSGNTNSHLPGFWLGRNADDTADDYKRKIELTETIVKVACYSLDQLIDMPDIPNPNFVKIDIEGAELEALQNLEKMCEVLRPTVLLELHNPECDAMAWEFSQKFRYKLYSFYLRRMITNKSDTGGTLLCTPAETPTAGYWNS